MIPSGGGWCSSGGGRGNVIDAAGDNDLVQRRILFPAVVAVGIAGADGAILAVAAGDQAVIEHSCTLRQGGDDLDRPDIWGEVRKIGRLVARASADLQHLVAALDLERIGHARDRMRAGDGDAEANVEMMRV